jgi:Fanconi anemia group M protein
VPRREAFAKPFVIIEGDISLLFSIRNVAPNAILGALSSLVLDWNVPILITKNKEETADLLLVIAKREQLEKKRSLPMRPEQKPQLLDEAQQFFVEGLPQIGPETARALLKHFKSPKNIVVAEESDLKNVDGIGEKKAELIRKLLDTEFKD